MLDPYQKPDVLQVCTFNYKTPSCITALTYVAPIPFGGIVVLLGKKHRTKTVINF